MQPQNPAQNPQTAPETDLILQKFFETERWRIAIEKGVAKDLPHSHLLALTAEETRIDMARAIREGRYEIAPPHTAHIPKENGEYRTVYINEPIDRLLLSIANDLLFELAPQLIHPSSKAYQTGIGCGAVVKEASQAIQQAPKGARNEPFGWKADLSKYFDSVPLRYIHQAFDRIEALHGHSSLIDVLRKYYNNNLYFDTDGNLQESYQSLKQGCAVASWLANVLLYDIDQALSSLTGYYVRYSDDLLYIGKDHEAAMTLLRERLEAMQLTLNPRKVEQLTATRWFKFLGFSIKGSHISLSQSRIKTFQQEIEARTFRHPHASITRAVNAVNRYLYKGNGTHSWATQVLPVCNVKEDIRELNKFVMDCLRATLTGKHQIGGLGYVDTSTNGCVHRGAGKNVRANRQKTPPCLPGYRSMLLMQQALLTNRHLYNTLVLTL